MTGNAFNALQSLELLAFSTGAESMSSQIAYFLNCKMWQLTSVLEDLKALDPTDEIAAFGDRFRQAFAELQRQSSAWCQKAGVGVRHAFRRMGDILYCLFHRRQHARPKHALLTVHETDARFRAAVIDRIADGLRALFAWLRDVCARAEAAEEIPLGPVVLGASAAKFVVKADTSEGVLVLKFQNGHQELFNLTRAQWVMIMPLLVTPHELGHAHLRGRPQSMLTRCDANGDEKEGDLMRLKQYIHPVGRGRGGNGMYFLAPHPRRLNVVDKLA